METKQLRPYQINALNAIKKALANGQKRIVVEMALGSGKGIVLSKTIEHLQKLGVYNILIINENKALKEQLKHQLYTNFNGITKIDDDSILIETRSEFLKHYNKKIFEQDIVILYDANISTQVYNALLCEEKIVIVFTTIGNEISKNKESLKKLFATNEIVFSYTLQEAINDGYMTPAMNAITFETAVKVFSKNLLEQFGCAQFNDPSNESDQVWDLILKKDKQRILVECKCYKSQVVSPSVANDLLKNVVMRKMKERISQEDIILLIVFNNIPSFQKDEIYNRYRIIVWDIENLVFYSKSNLTLLKQLSQITYFPIAQIEGQPSEEAKIAQLIFVSTEDKHLEDAEEDNKNALLIQKLVNCPTGREASEEYEEICEEVIRHLLEANYFNRLTSQHKTNDEHFRMDLIGSLKITQNNDESMHPLWRMLVQHYNSHFVVFEFKNYTEKIGQNLIYITEKYLFDAALRNVAFIISRKGFSDAAKFAAEGCLKEHSKLILDITQNDLIEMLKYPSDNPADYILTKLEEFLMGISK